MIMTIGLVVSRSVEAKGREVRSHFRVFLVERQETHCYTALFVCGCVGVGVCGTVTTITRNCVHRSSPIFVCR